MLVPNRNYQSPEYRYGYQGSEKDDDVKGEGKSYTTHFRQLDPRIAKWLSRDPKVTAFESPYNSMSNNPILYNDKLGDTIRIREIADYQGKGIKYQSSKSGDYQLIGDYTVVPYYDSKNNLVGYGAGREKEKNIGVEYYLDPGDITKFKENIKSYTSYANLFYTNGVPEEGVIAMAAGDTWKGLKKQWSKALKDPKFYYNLAMQYAGMRVAKGRPVSRTKRQFTKKGYKYEVRSHPADPDAPIGSNSANGPTYRVSRHKDITNKAQGTQGSGREYIDQKGNWHHESILREKFKDGRPNPNYNAKFANDTHIPNR